jgi:hypothetical protein
LHAQVPATSDENESEALLPLRTTTDNTDSASLDTGERL